MIVDQIVANMESIIGTLLPDWKELDYVWNLEKNSNRNVSQRFGVRPLASTFAPGVIKNITIDQTFEVILANSFKNVSKNDISQREALYDLYDKMDQVAVEIHAKKVNLPGSVLLVSYIGYEDPLFFEDQNILAILRGRFNIKYRNSL